VTGRQEEVLLVVGTEALARAIHEDYVRKQAEAGHTPTDNPSMVRWDELPEHLKESNRRQANDIGTKLRAIRCRIVPLTGEEQDGFEFRPLELEFLARMEHDRWWQERMTDGWSYAPEKNVQRKESPYLIPWEELPDDVKELDRNAVCAIPEVLAGAGLGIVRLEQERGNGQDNPG
jgi:hypothetical protein